MGIQRFVLCCIAVLALLIGTGIGEEVLMGLDQVSLLAKAGYAAQEHFVKTSDKYVLSLFHLEPRAPSRGDVKVIARRPVFLQAGLIDSSKSLVNLGKDSLVSMLVEQGYDVWMGNNRGNAWSKRHIEYDVNRHEFWDFSWDEMGSADLPAAIEYILKFTGQDSLSYVGHSQGNAQVFACLSQPENKWLASKINLHVALAPVAYLSHMSSPLLKFLANTPVPELVEKAGVQEFANTPDALHDLFPALCEILPTGCKDLLSLGFGHSDHILEEDYDTFVTGWPSGTSVRNVMHFVQMIRHSRFAKYDFGGKENIKRYGSKVAPAYDLSNYVDAGVPTLFVSGTNDMLASPKDVSRLRAEINATIVDSIQVDGYAHMDFLWARDASKLIYPQIIQALDRSTRIELLKEHVSTQVATKKLRAARFEEMQLA